MDNDVLDALEDLGCVYVLYNDYFFNYKLSETNFVVNQIFAWNRKRFFLLFETPYIFPFIKYHLLILFPPFNMPCFSYEGNMLEEGALVKALEGDGLSLDFMSLSVWIVKELKKVCNLGESLTGLCLQMDISY